MEKIGVREAELVTQKLYTNYLVKTLPSNLLVKKETILTLPIVDLNIN